MLANKTLTWNLLLKSLSCLLYLSLSLSLSLLLMLWIKLGSWVKWKTLNIFYLVIYWTQKVQNDLIFLRSLHCVPYKCFSFRKCMDTSRKKVFLPESAATRAPPAAPLRRTWKSCFPSPLWAVQRHESHWAWGLASTADVEDTGRTDLGLLQQLNGQYGFEHCHVARKHLYSEVLVVSTLL